MKYTKEYVDDPHEAECLGCGEEEPICKNCNTSQGAGSTVYCDGSGENHLCESCKTPARKGKLSSLSPSRVQAGHSDNGDEK